MLQQIILSENIKEELSNLCSAGYDRIFILADETTAALCLPQIMGCTALNEAGKIVIGSTDIHKNLDTLAKVWLSVEPHVIRCLFV